MTAELNSLGLNVQTRQCVITIYGDHGSGKTPLISKICKNLETRFPVNSIFPRVIGAGGKNESRCLFFPPYRKVGVISESDQCNVLIMDLMHLFVEHCETILCASVLSDPNTMEYVKKIASYYNFTLLCVNIDDIKRVYNNDFDKAAIDISSIL